MLKLSKQLILTDLGGPLQSQKGELNWDEESTICMRKTNLLTKLFKEHDMKNTKPASSLI